jgi:hypothetical protein
MEPRTINLPVTFRVGSRPVLGAPAGGSTQVWATVEVPDDRHGGRRYELTIGTGVGDTRMAARAIHADRRHGDRRLYAQADLTPFVEALFDQLAELLERPVFACCDDPTPGEGGVCAVCGTRLSDDQLRALIDCPHPTLTGVPPGEREPCPDCGLAWCQALGVHEVAALRSGRLACPGSRRPDPLPAGRHRPRLGRVDPVRATPGPGAAHHPVRRGLDPPLPRAELLTAF